MKFLYGLGGANIPVIRDFEITPTSKYEAGEVVTCSTDGIISKGAIGPAVGVAAEDHSGEKDILNERSDKNKLLIDITSNGVYSIDAPKLTATKTCTATTFVCAADNIATGLSNAKLVLIKKGENSANTDSIGTERTVTSVSVSDNVATFTVNAAGIPDTGDVYALFPVYGYKGHVANDKKSFTCTSGTGITLSVIGHDKKTACLEVLLGSRYFE